MKRTLLCLVAFCIFAGTVTFQASAQDTLKVNFKPAGTPGAVGWDSLLVTDKAAYDAGGITINKFSRNISVQPMWLNTPNPENVRAVDRDTEQYTGKWANALRSYIAVDSRYVNDCNILGIEISGLPAGTYTFTSFHHDFNDQFGTFMVETTVGGTKVDSDKDGIMVSHSLDLVSFEGIYGELEESVGQAYAEHYVSASIDSVSKYTFNQIVSSAETDVIKISFENILTPDADMGHNVKFSLVNGFILYETPATDLADHQIDSKNISIINQAEGRVSIQGQDISGLEVYSVHGALIRRENIRGDKIEINNLQSGIYIAMLRFTNGTLISKQFVVQ